MLLRTRALVGFAVNRIHPLPLFLYVLNVRELESGILRVLILTRTKLFTADARPAGFDGGVEAAAGSEFAVSLVFVLGSNSQNECSE